MEQFTELRIEIYPYDKGSDEATAADWKPNKIRFILDGETIDDIMGFTTGMSQDDTIYQVNYLRNLGPAPEGSEEIYLEEYKEILVTSLTVDRMKHPAPALVNPEIV